MAFHVSTNPGVLESLCGWQVLELQDRVLCWGCTESGDGRCDAPSSDLGTETPSSTDETEDRSHCCSYDWFVVSAIFDSNVCAGIR